MDRRNKHPELVAFGKAVRELRTAKGFSQEGFADACELDRTYIGGIERGERNVGFLNLMKLSRALGISPAELLAKTEL